MAWPTASRRTVYTNPWITVTEDAVTRPDGSDGVYGVVQLAHESVFVVAMTADDEVVLVSVDRHTVGVSVEIVSGGSDGQEPLVAARRELFEETGFEATIWRQLGRVESLNGICRAPGTVFLATGLLGAGLPGARGSAASSALTAEQASEGISGVRPVPWGEVMRMLRDGEITDGETAAALMLVALELGRVG